MGGGAISPFKRRLELSPIRAIAPSDSQYEHPQNVVLDIADDAIASYPVTPPTVERTG